MNMAVKDKEALEERANDLEARGFNGIRLVLVTLVPVMNPSSAKLEVHFHNANQLPEILSKVQAERRAAAKMFPIHGGHRIVGGRLRGQVRVTDVVQGPEADSLVLTVAPIGDYSTYTLGIFHTHIDPVFNEIEFKFRPGCFNNCGPEWKPPAKPLTDPAIDYLAKDYDSFKHTLIAWMMDRVPGWQATSEADLDMVLIELFANAADELSDYQDRVMNEAFLGTARKRVSLTRHARLMDYHVHQGNQASTWMALNVRTPVVIEKGFQVWTGEETRLPDAIVFQGKEERSAQFMIDDIDGALRDDLDDATVSSSIISSFNLHGITLSPTSLVTSENPGMNWLISDGDNHHVHFIKRYADKLEVWEPHLHNLLNGMGLYTWSGTIPTLKAGSTTADLRITESGDKESAFTVESLLRNGGVDQLMIQEWLNPDNGIPAGRDRTKRQLLNLVEGNTKQVREHRAKAKMDPVTGQWFVRVNWVKEDALEHAYCYSTKCRTGIVEGVSLFHGNLMKVHHGDLRTTTYREPGSILTGIGNLYFERSRKEEAICKIPSEDLIAYTDTPPGGEVAPISTMEVEIEVNGTSDPWEEAIDLVHSDGSDEQGDHFVVETDEYGRSLLRFGNGVNGRQLPDGAVVHCSYQVGRGPDGNIGPDTLVHCDGDLYSELTELWNPFDVTSGRDPEPFAEVIRRAPEAFRARQLRAITLQDYVDRVEELDEVSRATARYLWTGSWRTLRIAVDPLGTTEVSDTLRKKVIDHLNALRLIGDDLEIRSPLFVPLDITLSVNIHPDYWREDIKEVLEMEFSDGYTPDGRKGFFHPDRWTFGQELRDSQILGRVHGIDGIDHVNSLSMKRWNEATPGNNDRIEVRTNEIILVKNDPDHMEEGIIRFELTGGRG